MSFPALFLACGLSLLALAYVLYPLYRSRSAKPAPVSPLSTKDMQPPTSDGEQAARLSLQEVELDYQLGNIAETDYRSLRERYIRRAILAMKARHDNTPDGQLEHEHEEISQNGRDAEIDLMIEEQLRKMREKHGDGGNDDE
ncbi:MAG TPA: hypothetical protein VKU38_16105 [Ktedonobacteraceae bacterium]|nr:hypothetical protein [Ktedonobacteraceae bacterium]